MKFRKNQMPVAPISLRLSGPQLMADLKKRYPGFRFAHGLGTDRRATVDPTPCPECNGKVEWALTYRREQGVVVPYIYARCRNAPKSHRWDFTHWVPETTQPAQARMAANIKRPATPPAPRPSAGTELMSSWLDKRIAVLSAELEKLSKIRALAGEVANMRPMPPAMSPVPDYQGVSPQPTPGNGDLGKG